MILLLVYDTLPPASHLLACIQLLPVRAISPHHASLDLKMPPHSFQQCQEPRVRGTIVGAVGTEVSHTDVCVTQGSSQREEGMST